MWIVRLALRRPYTFVVLSLLIAVLGIGAAIETPKDIFPSIDIPVVTVVALQFGALFSGTLVTETMFAWQGMGKMIYDAVLGNDYNLALIGLLFATSLTLFGNLLADLAYAWLDPRISYK